MKQKIITIKAKGKSGFTRTLGEIEFSQMIDKDDFDIITSQKDDGDGIPDSNWTKSDIMNYLESKSIDFKSSDNKADLLALC